jgi:hypothetical protein
MYLLEEVNTQKIKQTLHQLSSRYQENFNALECVFNRFYPGDKIVARISLLEKKRDVLYSKLKFDLTKGVYTFDIIFLAHKMNTDKKFQREIGKKQTLFLVKELMRVNKELFVLNKIHTHRQKVITKSVMKSSLLGLTF